MKFLHAADIHLDSPLSGLQSRADLPAEIIQRCTRRAFEAMVSLALEEDVAFMVIAGDLYDGDWKDFSTGLFFAEQMRRFNRPCFLLRGNHDAHSVITRNLSLPPNVQEFSSHSCQTLPLPELGVALHGRSFPNRAVPEDLSAAYRPSVPGMLNIGVLHTSAEDPGEHEVYAPCSVAALALKGYDYWALGHIHARQVLHERPWIVFPGNLQGRHARETGAKGCTLVTVEDRVITSVEHRDVDVLRWAAMEVDATNSDMAALSARIQAAAQTAVEAAAGRPLLARLTLIGETRLHGALLGDPDRLAAECRAAAMAAGGDLWTEKVRIRTRLPRSTDAALLAPLQDAFMGGLDDPELIESLLRDLADLRRRLPAEALLELPGDAEGLRQLAEDAWALTAEALSGTETP
ncbi:DNA repair exonuclease [Roseomonas hellenica]|uniref:DNA repair exonuclease n=1 Tax=Plastoroseomonas hellenica TaxID=2687306 RepID=A0ABS5EVR5_9PROT|nr:DNA repair exonuclease [Plastoroseomonas hellenica]